MVPGQKGEKWIKSSVDPDVEMLSKENTQTHRKCSEQHFLDKCNLEEQHSSFYPVISISLAKVPLAFQTGSTAEYRFLAPSFLAGVAIGFAVVSRSRFGV